MPIRGHLSSSLLVALALGGCASVDTSVAPRASFDMQCPVTQLQLAQIGEEQYSATGCGLEAGYYRSCEAAPPAGGSGFGNGNVNGGETTGRSRFCTWREGYMRPIGAPAMAATASGGERPVAAPPQSQPPSPWSR